MAYPADVVDALARAAAAIAPTRRLALICHSFPDADCVGGMLGFARALRATGRAVVEVSPHEIPHHLHFLPDWERIAVAPERFPAVDAAITIEVPSLERLEPIASRHRAALAGATVINLDHHVTNDQFGTVNVVAPRLSSICEMLLALCGELGAPINAAVATCLLAGIVSDTRSFRTSAVTDATLAAASTLVAAGADLFAVGDAVHRTRPVDALRLWARAVDGLARRGGVVGAAVTQALLQETGTQMSQSDGLVEFLSDASDVDVAVVFKEDLASTRVSMRSAGLVDVAAICARYGGGGHVRAAGCTLEMSLADARERIMSELDVALRAAR